MKLSLVLILLDVCAHPVVNHGLAKKPFYPGPVKNVFHKAHTNGKKSHHHKPASWKSNPNEELKHRVDKIENLIEGLAAIFQKFTGPNTESLARTK